MNWHLLALMFIANKIIFCFSRLYNKIKESDNSAESENEALKNIVHSICKAFPGEQLAPGLLSIRDSIVSIQLLYFSLLFIY